MDEFEKRHLETWIDRNILPEYQDRASQRMREFVRNNGMDLANQIGWDGVAIRSGCYSLQD